MARIDAVLLILLVCVVCTGVLIVLRWPIKWNPVRRFFNVAIGTVIIFITLMFLALTFGHNSYDSAFNKAFAQYFNVPTEDKRMVLEQERKRKMKDETFESLAAGIALVICILATYLSRAKHPTPLTLETR
jgi:phosphoglycerol transferase MdoB-like AlkP superfamily enzyme